MFQTTNQDVYRIIEQLQVGRRIAANIILLYWENTIEHVSICFGAPRPMKTGTHDQRYSTIISLVTYYQYRWSHIISYQYPHEIAIIIHILYHTLSYPQIISTSISSASILPPHVRSPMISPPSPYVRQVR